MRKISSIFLCCGALVSINLAAAPIKVVGLDDMSCEAWKHTAQDPDSRAVFVMWVRGVLTGHNYARQTEQVAAMSSATVENFVENYCVQNPRSNVADAAFRMADRFSGRNEPIKK